MKTRLLITLMVPLLAALACEKKPRAQYRDLIETTPDKESFIVEFGSGRACPNFAGLFACTSEDGGKENFDLKVEHVMGQYISWHIVGKDDVTSVRTDGEIYGSGNGATQAADCRKKSLKVTTNNKDKNVFIMQKFFRIDADTFKYRTKYLIFGSYALSDVICKRKPKT